MAVIVCPAGHARLRFPFSTAGPHTGPEEPVAASTTPERSSERSSEPPHAAKGIAHTSSHLDECVIVIMLLHCVGVLRRDDRSRRPTDDSHDPRGDDRII